MNQLRNLILMHMRFSTRPPVLVERRRPLYELRRYMCASSINTSSERMMDRVIELVKKFDKIDASKVTKTADFQKDLSLDSLDRVELVMAFEQEFSIEIPDDKADKLTCCADVVKYIVDPPMEGSLLDGGLVIIHLPHVTFPWLHDDEFVESRTLKEWFLYHIHRLYGLPF